MSTPQSPSPQRPATAAPAAGEPAAAPAAPENLQVGTLAANIVDLDGPNNHIKFAHSETRYYRVGINGDESKMSFTNRDGFYTLIIDGQQGDIMRTNADCAEDFDVAADAAELAEPGAVMVIDDDGTLRPSSQAYDSRVAGIISGAGTYQPAMVLDRQPGVAGRAPLALIGKVFCKVDADTSPVAAGDLLTTSPVPGHAMKVADTARAVGATLGKALRSLSSGSALIPVLVTSR